MPDNTGIKGISVETACHLKGEDPKGRTKPNELRLKTMQRCRGGRKLERDGAFTLQGCNLHQTNEDPD